MTIERTGGANLAPIVVSEFDTVAAALVELSQQAESSERDALSDEREAARIAGERRLGQMREAADFRLAAGLADAGSTVASGIVGVSSAAARMSSIGGPGGEAAVEEGGAEATGEAAIDPDGATATGGAADDARAIARELRAEDARVSEGTQSILSGVGRATSSIAESFASQAEQRAERARMAADEANSRAEEARAEATSARERGEAAIDTLGTTLEERRRAEEAASRA
jgi:hypothetical protein